MYFDAITLDSGKGALRGMRAVVTVCAILFVLAERTPSASAQSAGFLQDVGLNNVVVQIGAGSDEHAGLLGLGICEINVDGTRDQCGDATDANGGSRCSCCGTNTKSDSCGLNEILTGWTWDIGTTGGGVPSVCANDDNPADECYYQGWQSIDPQTALRTGGVNGFGSAQDGSCNDRLYGYGNLKIVNERLTSGPYTAPYWMPYRVFISTDQDGTPNWVDVACRAIPIVTPPALDDPPPSNVCNLVDNTTTVTMRWPERPGADYYTVGGRDPASPPPRSASALGRIVRRILR